MRASLLYCPLFPTRAIVYASRKGNSLAHWKYSIGFRGCNQAFSEAADTQVRTILFYSFSEIATSLMSSLPHAISCDILNTHLSEVFLSITSKINEG